MPTPRRTAAALAGLLLALGALAGCGDDDDLQTTTDDVGQGDEVTDGAADGGGAAAGTCLEGTTDCQDTVTDPDAPVSSPADGGSVSAPGAADDEYPSEAARQRAQEQLGRPEADLEPDVRIGRRGDEQYSLTEDYVLGRITVELDDDGTGTFVVTQATVELPGGPETFTLDQD